MRGRKVIDVTGQKFGRLTVISRAENSKTGQVRWLCECECGNQTVVQGADLRRGRTKSCGCWNSEKNSKRSKTHGMTRSKIYRTWQGIKTRCFNQNNHKYSNYGGRGIAMFPEWINDFQKFYEYVSKLPHYGEDGYSLDRIDNNGNYEPNNLRFATTKEQSLNQRRTIFVEYQGVMMTLMEAAELSGIPYKTLLDRYHAGDRGEYLFRPVKK